MQLKEYLHQFSSLITNQFTKIKISKLNISKYTITKIFQKAFAFFNSINWNATKINFSTAKININSTPIFKLMFDTNGLINSISGVPIYIKYMNDKEVFSIDDTLKFELVTANVSDTYVSMIYGYINSDKEAVKIDKYIFDDEIIIMETPVSSMLNSKVNNNTFIDFSRKKAFYKGFIIWSFHLNNGDVIKSDTIIYEREISYFTH